MVTVLTKDCCTEVEDTPLCMVRVDIRRPWFNTSNTFLMAVSVRSNFRMIQLEGTTEITESKCLTTSGPTKSQSILLRALSKCLLTLTGMGHPPLL